MTVHAGAVDLKPHDLAEVVRLLQWLVPEFAVWAFGSRVKWTAKSYSDLDLAIITDVPLPLARLAELKEAFDESSLPMRVDLVDWARTSESFRRIIQEQKIEIKPAATDDPRHSA